MESVMISSICLNAKSDEVRKDVTYGAMSLLPLVGCLGTLLPKLETDINAGLNGIRAAQTDTDNGSCANAIRTIEASMRIISQNIPFLNDAEFKSQSQVTMVHSIHDHLDTIIDHFDQAHAIFRKHPLHALRPIISIVSFFAIFHPVMEIIAPNLLEESYLSCKISDVLAEYRALVVDARLDKISGELDCTQYRDYVPKSFSSQLFHVKNIMVDVTRRKYDKNGYSDLSVVRCDNSECRHDEISLIDDVNNKMYHAGSARLYVAGEV